MKNISTKWVSGTLNHTDTDATAFGLLLAITVLFCLGISLSQAQPVNDLFGNRIVLPGTSIVTTGSNVGATKEPGEPDHAGNTGGASIWWEWTAPSSDTVIISTAGSSFDTVLGVYTGDSVSTLTEVASNDDDPDVDDYTSKVVFGAAANQTYQIAVDGFEGHLGSVQLWLKVGYGEIVAWGDTGQADVPDGLSNVVSVACGGSHSLALTADDKVTGWGDNSYGQTNVPGGLSNVVAVATGGGHSLALMADGRARGWGQNQITYYVSHPGGLPSPRSLWVGQATVPAGVSNMVAIAAGGYHSLALTSEGQVVTWGIFSYHIRHIGKPPTPVISVVPSQIPSGLSNVVAIAAGGSHSLALTGEGRVVWWSSNGSGWTNVLNGLSNVVTIAAGGSHSLALTSEGRVVGWGNNGNGQTNVPSGLSNVVAIAAGGDHSLALTADGRVVAWGDNYSGETNVPSGLINVVAIAAGGSHSLALTRQTTVPAPGLELSQGLSGLELRAHGAAGISCQLLRASSLTGPWLPTQPVTFTNNVQLLRTPSNSAPAQFFRLLRK